MTNIDIARSVITRVCFHKKMNLAADSKTANKQKHLTNNCIFTKQLKLKTSLITGSTFY